jgi:hypothetical protein
LNVESELGEYTEFIISLSAWFFLKLIY